MKRNIKLTISILIIFSGLCLLLSTYYSDKKHQIFDEMNKLYYEELISLNDDEVEELEEVVEDESKKEETIITTTTTTKPIIDYSKYYIGYLKIPSINLDHGFTSKDSKYNNVNKNIFVHKTSDYPNVKNGNLILASHSGNSAISYFKNLYKLKVNDDVYVNYEGKEYHYKITKIYTDKKDGKVKVIRNKDVTTLTLITCTKNDKTTQTIYICELV